MEVLDSSQDRRANLRELQEVVNRVVESSTDLERKVVVFSIGETAAQLRTRDDAIGSAGRSRGDDSPAL